jgi:tol-pal system protein YbgF
VSVRAWWVGCAGVAALAGGCATTPPDQDPVQIKLNDLDSRLTRVERVMANQSLLDLSNQVEALRGDVRALHNDVDVLSHNLEAARKQQHDLYADLDQRLKTLEGRGGAAGTPGGAAAAGAPGDSSADSADKASYQAAFDLLKSAQYDRAILAFQAFLASYPTSSLADNAQYWLGEAHYVNKSYPEALVAFRRVVENFPQSRKLPDALLKIGYCNYELKDYSAARTALSQVTARYSDSTAAPLAQQRLDKMAAERH